jgi:hypothetical protein
MTKPALTPEEWAELCADWYSVNRGPYLGWPVADGARRLEIEEDKVEVHLDPDEYTAIPQWGLHAVAALCLHGQPFGFTWDDVAMLREEGSVGYPETGRKLRDLADRIEALLPPE